MQIWSDRFEGSLANYRQALWQREHVAAADPRDVNASDTVVRAHLSIGQVFRRAGRLPEAIPPYLKARDIAAERYARDPSNGAAGERLANAYGGLAAIHAALASSARNPNEAAAHWRETRASAQKSLDLWSRQRAGGALSEVAQGEADSLAALLARSDAELGTLAAQRVK